MISFVSLIFRAAQFLREKIFLQPQPSFACEQIHPLTEAHHPSKRKKQYMRVERTLMYTPPLSSGYAICAKHGEKKI